MFEEFGKEQASEGGKRRGVSALLSLAIFGGIAVILGGAITAHQVRARRHEKDMEVTFADLPKVKAPKPKPVVQAAKPKKAASRPKPLAVLKDIPDERPEEAEGDLGAADEAGPIEGVIEEKPAVAAAPPPPPKLDLPPPPPPAEQEREEIVAPRRVSGCRSPEVPLALLNTAATVRIEVRMLIDATGRVLSASILEPHPLVPDALVLDCARAQVFEPARTSDGVAVQWVYKARFVFRPSQAGA